MNLKNITADKLVSLYANRDLSVTEVITSVFDEIDRSDEKHSRIHHAVPGTRA